MLTQHWILVFILCIGNVRLTPGLINLWPFIWNTQFLPSSRLYMLTQHWILIFIVCIGSVGLDTGIITASTRRSLTSQVTSSKIGEMGYLHFSSKNHCSKLTSGNCSKKNRYTEREREIVVSFGGLVAVEWEQILFYHCGGRIILIRF